ncbi:MAG TPA: sigma-54 dependent transcriptional regulator, partial [Anaeromyxobacter sp.]|nr:sigma-54 dependent transcriptional regulator [Anaeromyxobacter sp.]
MTAPDTGRVLEVVLATAPAPLSMDTLVSWNLARPAELFAFLTTSELAGAVSQPAPGHFALQDPARRHAALARATPADWSAFLSAPDRLAWAIEAGRAAAATQRPEVAGPVFRALIASKPRDAFPGGERAWLQIVLQGLRLFRTMTGIADADLEDAVSLAVSLGDIAAQGVLHGALAAAALRDGKTDDARRHLALAREAGRASSGPLRAEIHMYLAIGLVLQGRPRDGVDAFEELLGDVPEDIESLIEPSSSAPATGLFVIALAYARAGQVPRALDLVHRIRSFGRERGLAAVEREADAFAAIVHLEIHDFAAAREHAERAYAFYVETRRDLVHVWYAAQALACVRAWEGRHAEVPAILAAGLEARFASRWPWIASSCVFGLLEELEVEGIRLDGLRLEEELERLLAWNNPTWRGIGHRFRARQLARAPRGDEDLRAVREHLERSIAYLREAGATHELSRAIADAAGLARGGGRADDALRLEAQLREGATRTCTCEGCACHSAAHDGHARLTGVLLELGRLGTLAERREGTWGEIAARLCRALAAERCAIAERGDPPALLGLRGGNAAWREAVLAVLRERAPDAVAALPAPAIPGETASGQLLVVPFAAEGRAGWACIENRYGAPAVGPADRELLEVLSVQLGVLLGNVALWQALASAREQLEEENRYWRSTRPATAPGSRIVGDSPALRGVLELVARVAPTTTSVLVTGETGVGKELVASEIHRQSPRRDGPFIAVHVASLSPGLVASGLFGHERGAFTGATEQAKGRFELANGGTLFLDEVGELSGEDQVRLLRVLQEGAFERVGGTRAIRSDFRLVAATNRDLQAEVRAGRFREDLYFRLAAFPLRVPPLRERLEEIPTLALFFMERAARARGARFEGIGEADMRRMLEYPWPGNVRELEHVIERAVVLSEPPRLRIPPLDAATRAPSVGAATAAAAARGNHRRDWVSLAEAERRYIADVLHH